MDLDLVENDLMELQHPPAEECEARERVGDGAGRGAGGDPAEGGLPPGRRERQGARVLIRAQEVEIRKCFCMLRC